MLPERAFSNTGEKLHLFPGVPASNWQYLCQYKRREEEFAFFIFCALRSTSSHLICIVVISFFGSISWLMEIGLYKKTRRHSALRCRILPSRKTFCRYNFLYIFSSIYSLPLPIFSRDEKKMSSSLFRACL